MFPLLSLLGSPALAKDVSKDNKFTHKSSAAPVAKLTERSKPVPKKDEPVAPRPTGDDLLKVEGLVGEIHEEQIALLEGMIRDTPKDAIADRADLAFRLGELYAKINRFHRLAAVDDDLRLAKADAATQAKLKKSIDDHRTKEHAALIGTLKTLKDVVDDPDFAKAPHMDAMVFYLAYTLEHAGQGVSARAREYYDKLLKNYPASKYVVNAHYAFAEAHFDANQWQDAESRYKQVLKFPASSLFWYAQYKLGWVALNLKKAQDAFQAFYQVATATKSNPELAVLNRAAKHDVVRAYAEVGRADKALPMFQKIDTASAYEMLATLADIYLDQGKVDRAIFVYRQLMTDKPTSPDVCVWEHSIARAMLAMKDTPTTDKVKEIEEFVRLYAALSAKKTLPKDAATECRESAAEMSVQLAHAYHQEAVKTLNPELATYANRLYAAYLGAFKDAPDWGDNAFYRAELAWLAAEQTKDQRLATQRWEDAAASYNAAIDSKKLSPETRQKSAYYAMLALLKAASIDPRQKPAATTVADDRKPVAPRPIPEMEQKLLAAFDGYLAQTTDAKDGERVDVLFNKGLILHRYDQLEKAMPIFDEIVKKHPEHEAAEYAAQRMMNSLERLKRYDELLAYAQGLPKDYVEAHPDLKEVVKKVMRVGARKVAEKLEKEGLAAHDFKKLVQCALQYYEIYNLDPLADDGDELLYNAGVCFEEGHSLTAAKEAYERLQKFFPKSPHTQKAIVRLGLSYASIAFYKEAAERLEEFATKYAGEEEAFKVLSDAVLYRKGIGDDDKAIADALRFIRVFGDKHPDKAAAVHWALGAIYEKSGDLDKIAAHLREYIARFGKIGGPERLVAAQAKLGVALWQAACPIKTVDGACMRLTRAVAIAGHQVASTTASGVIPKRCGEETKSEFTMVPRDARKVRDAMAALDAAVAIYESNKGAMTDARGALSFYAQARFTRIEREYEDYLASPIPGGLAFQNKEVADKSRKRFLAWFDQKRAVGTGLKDKYTEIVNLKDGPIAIAAAARLASVFQNFSTQLFRAEIPVDQRTGPFAEVASETYCTALEEMANPLETVAKDMYGKCLETSEKLGWFSEWSEICQRELHQLEPAKYSSTAERRAAAVNVSHIGDVEGPAS